MILFTKFRTGGLDHMRRGSNVVLLENTQYPYNNNNLTNSYWSIGSTKNVKADRAQTREMGGMETQFLCG